MKMRRFFYWGFFLLSFVSLFCFRFLMDYKVLSWHNFDLLGKLELFLAFLELIAILVFLSFLWVLYTEITMYLYQRIGFLEDVVLFCLFLVFIFLVVPSFVYSLGFLCFGHLFLFNYGEISQVLPDISTKDFFALCMNGQPLDPKKVSAMGDHIVVAGVHENNNYVCVNVKAMLAKAEVSKPAELGIKGVLRLVGIPDVLCSGLTEEQIPTAGQVTKVLPKK